MAEKFKEMAARVRAAVGPEGVCGMLAVPCTYTFVPEEAETEYLQGLVEGRYDSMNAGDDEQEAKDIEAAKVELRRRGLPV